MAKAWPKLVPVSLGDKFGCRGWSVITTKGLVPLFENCEDLKELRIVLDATVVDHNLFEKPGQGISNRKIKTLYLGNSE